MLNKYLRHSTVSNYLVRFNQNTARVIVNPCAFSTLISMFKIYEKIMSENQLNSAGDLETFHSRNFLGLLICYKA